MGMFDRNDAEHPCWRCEHWGGDIADGSHALCLHGAGRQVQAQPERGCVFWVRATGSDDEDGSDGMPNAGLSTRRRQ
jgi:hypothetical protein